MARSRRTRNTEPPDGERRGQASPAPPEPVPAAGPPEETPEPAGDGQDEPGGDVWLDRRRPLDPGGAWGDRRQSSERRSGGDRREPGDRRSGHDRRSGRDRRGEDLGPPPGVRERRSDRDRRAAERRSGRDRRDDAGWAAIPIDQVVVDAFDYEDVLLDAARAARSRARARYSGFRVGAALETIDGQIVTGCNIENASYGLTTCAERVALLKALSDGHEVFTRLVVVADSDEPTTPCGPCRQLLWEYCGDIQVILASTTEVKRRYQLGRLLPMPFDHRHLK